MPYVKKQLKSFTNLLNKEQTQILETSFVLMLPVLLTKITGQVFTLILTSYYSAEDPRINQFFIANAIPGLLTTVLMIGAVGTVVIPVLESVKAEHNKEKFYRVYSSIANISIILFIIVSAIIFAFADEFIPLAVKMVDSSIEPGEASINNIIWMMRALIFPQLLLGISVYISTGLNVYDRYLVPQLSPLVYNIGRIAVLMALLPALDMSPWAIVLAAYLGSVLHLLVQLPLYLKLKIKYMFAVDIRDPYIKEIAILGFPRIIILGSEQLGFLVNSFIALAFVAGPAALNYAKSLYLVIPTLFGYTFSYASYPKISRHLMKGETEQVSMIIRKTLNEIFFLSLPFTVILLILRVPIVRIVYGIIPNTAFKLIDSYQVAWVILFFSLGLVFITARWFIIRIFYAAKDTLTPSLVSIVSLVAVIGTSILFTNLFSYNTTFSILDTEISINNFLHRSEVANRAGVGGIALSMSLVYSLEFVVMLLIFNKYKVNIGLRKFVETLNRKFIAAGIMTLFTYFTYRLWSFLNYLPDTVERDYAGSTTLNLIILLLITIVPAFMIYFLICHLLKVEELKILRKYLNPVFKLGGLKIK